MEVQLNSPSCPKVSAVKMGSYIQDLWLWIFAKHQVIPKMMSQVLLSCGQWIVMREIFFWDAPMEKLRYGMQDQEIFR